MVDFAGKRYKNMEDAGVAWKKASGLSFEENVKSYSFNPGHSNINRIDLDSVLVECPAKNELIKALSEAESWLKSSHKWSVEEKNERGWQEAYTLKTWEDFPGENANVQSVILQNVTGGLAG